MRLSHLLAFTAAAALLAAPRATPAQAAEATVVCKDGTTSKAGRGACRGHGGVDKKASAPKEGASPKAAREMAPKTAPKEAAAPAAAETVVCKDGTTSKAGRGACRGHGGVDKGAQGGAPSRAPAAPAATAAPPAAAPPAPAPRSAPAAAPAPAPAPAPRAPAAAPAGAKNTDPAGAIARCKDGTYSHAKSHSGACSRHGGVAEWLDQPAK